MQNAKLGVLHFAFCNSSASEIETMSSGVINSSETVPAWPVVFTLAERELVRFFRQRNRVFGALGQPIIFWLLFSAGLGSTSFGGSNRLHHSQFFSRPPL